MKKITLSLLLFAATPLCAHQTIYQPTSMQSSLKQFNHPQAMGSLFSNTFQKPKYASLGKRFVAWLVDLIIIKTLSWLILYFITFDREYQILSLKWHFKDNLFKPIISILSEIGFIMIGGVGKRLLGIKVVDKEGKELAFGQACLRTVAKYITGFTPSIWWVLDIISILPIFFTEKQQALYDMFAETYVVEAA